MAERWRDIAGAVGHLETGERNAITDVPGVLVGHSQSEAGEASGVTIVAPPVLPAQAGTSTVNGVGELTAKLEIDELGLMETPVYLCGSHAVGTVFQAAVTISGRQPDHIVLPVVGECDDGDMADSRKITAGDVERASQALSAEVAEGSVGGGTGMSCYEFPGGIGTASRRVGDHHVGVLLMCNFGHREYLDVPGGPLGGARLSPRVTRLLHRRLRHGRAASLQPAQAPVVAHAARARADRLVRLGRLGRDRDRVHDRRVGRDPRARDESVLRGRVRGGLRVRLQLSRRGPARRGSSTGRCRTPSRSKRSGPLRRLS